MTNNNLYLKQITHPTPSNLNLNNRPLINPSRPNQIIPQTKEHRPPSPNHTIIHRLAINLIYRGPKAKESSYEHINQRKDINSDTPYTGDMKRTPDELGACRVDHRLFGVSLGLTDFSCAAAVEE